MICRLCSTEEPGDRGSAWWTENHPEERDRLPTQSHQRGSNDHHPAPTQSPTHAAVRALRRGAGGIHRRFFIFLN